MRSISLWSLEALFLFLDALQVFSLLLNLAVFRALAPESFLRGAQWILVFLLDIWDILRMQHYTGNSRPVDPALFAAGTDGTATGSYATVLFVWTGVCATLLVLPTLLYRALRHRPRSRARAERALFYLAYALYLPAAAAVARGYMCASLELPDRSVADVDHSLPCLSYEHLVLLAPATAVVGTLLIVLPLLAWRRTRRELIGSERRRHEAYLQLVETQFALGADSTWAEAHYFLFSPYIRNGVMFKPILLCLKLLLAVAYGALMWTPSYLALAQLLLLVLALMVVWWLRPFRVRWLNFCAAGFLVALCLDALILQLKTTELKSALLQEPALSSGLAVTNGAIFLGALLLVTVVFALEARGRISVWPVRDWPQAAVMGARTSRYLNLFVQARRLERVAWASPPTLAPCHELARYIQLVNAHCREAEAEGDPMDNALWLVLDELVQVHNICAKRSIFALTNKPSTRATAERLMADMPEFCKSLARRERAQALMSPRQRRILLKLSCVAAFAENHISRVVPAAAIVESFGPDPGAALTNTSQQQVLALEHEHDIMGEFGALPNEEGLSSSSDEEDRTTTARGSGAVGDGRDGTAWA